MSHRGGKRNSSPSSDDDPITDEIMVGDDGDRELVCIHNVGHSPEVHTCDGCCVSSLRFARHFKLRKRTRHK
jgi:hypothetical protein